MHYEFLSGDLYELFSEFSLKATIALDLVLNTFGIKYNLLQS
jgi:hypothetical protein